jgi:PHD/YefM family antitoxin component YafN of YafNO toxin-antitoxin module
MKLSKQAKPIGYLKENVLAVIRNPAEHQQPVLITLHREAKAVLQDIANYEETQEALALLKVLALTGKAVAEGKAAPAADAFARIRTRLEG